MFFFSSRRRHTRYWRDWSSDVCSSDLAPRLRRPTWAASPRGGPPFARERSARPVAPAAARSRRRTGGDRPQPAAPRGGRERVVWGERVDFGGRRMLKKKKLKMQISHLD